MGAVAYLYYLRSQDEKKKEEEAKVELARKAKELPVRWKTGFNESAGEAEFLLSRSWATVTCELVRPSRLLVRQVDQMAFTTSESIPTQFRPAGEFLRLPAVVSNGTMEENRSMSENQLGMLETFGGMIRFVPTVEGRGTTENGIWTRSVWKRGDTAVLLPGSWTCVATDVASAAPKV